MDINKYSREHVTITQEQIEFASRKWIEYFWDGEVRYHCSSIYDVVARLPKQPSAGYPNKEKTKEEFLIAHSEVLIDELSNVSDAIMDEDPPLFVSGACPKHEIRSVQNFLDGKTRMFVPLPIQYNILLGTFMYPFNDLLFRRNTLAGTTFGCDFSGRAWHDFWCYEWELMSSILNRHMILF